MLLTLKIKNKEENMALAECVAYHFRLSILTENFELSRDYFLLLRKLPYTLSFKDWGLLRIARWKLPVFPLYQIYLKIKSPAS